MIPHLRGFDLTNFWDDNWYALKEYVSDPPSDELIASVEEELGYKLPAAYIWLMKQHNGGIPVTPAIPAMSLPVGQMIMWPSPAFRNRTRKELLPLWRAGQPVYDR